jgi:long-subunit fatty acid transport protein
MLVRDASTGIDAVFYNPAGLSKLSDGFHFSISNQTLFQTQDINSTFPYLNGNDYEGTVKAPIFPGVYGVYKTGKVALSFGFNPVGGGGGATFDSGLPSMEIPFAGLVPRLTTALSPLGGSVSAYSMNMFFEGSSVYFGLQAGVTYEVNDWLSLYLGGRYIMAKNTYNGYIKDVQITTPSGVMAPGTYVNGVAGQAAAGATAAAGAVTSIQPLITAGAGGYTFDQLYGAGYITAAQRDQLKGGLLALGVPSTTVNAMSALVAQGTYSTFATQLAAAATQLYGTAIYLSGVTADQEADVIQKGDGFTPIIGANLSFMNEKLNIGIKYEFLTKMDLVDEVNDLNGVELGFVDGGSVSSTGVFTPTYMFNDGEITNADIPAFLSIGAAYKATDKLNVSVGVHTYFDQAAGWATDEDGNATVDGNFLEYGLGLEYALTDNFLISAGYLGTQTSATEFYNDDLSYSLNTNTLGGGGAFKLNDRYTVQFGGFYTMYKDATFDKLDAATGIAYTETYAKNTWAVSLGLDISLGKKKTE